MKLLLASSGFTNEAIIEACERLVGKPRSDINFIVINEAIKGETGDMRWFAETLFEIVNNFGGKMEFIDLQAHSLEHVQERIAANDVIFCFGGNADYLSEVFRKTGFDQILPSILEDKVWVGSSAGSCVLGYKESKAISEKVFQEVQCTDHYLEIVPLVFLPHLHGWFQFGEKEVLQESEVVNVPVYALSDQAALVIIDDKMPQIVGEDYIIAENGNIATSLEVF